MRTRSALVCVLYTVLGTVAACLPADTRPAPGTVTFTLSPSAAVVHGVTTVDGWSLEFDKVLIGIGDVGLGNTCVRYSDAGYDRVLDAAHGAGQHLSILYGLGTCDVRFRVTTPSAQSLLGEGVTEGDKTFLRTGGTDAYATNAGIALYVSGAATQGGRSARFRWAFRQRTRYQGCGVDIQDGGSNDAITLTGSSNFTQELTVAPERLFRDDLEEPARLRFAPFARADAPLGDGDSEITLAELAKVALTSTRPLGVYGIGKADETKVVSLEDYVYLILYPTLARYGANGACPANAGGRGGGGPGGMMD